MCLNSKFLPTTTKFVSLSYHDRFFNSYGCGKCVECQQLNSLQWSFRCNYEFDDLPDDGYVMFDCLSYRDSDLPHLSEVWTFLPKRLDFPCFNRKHIRNFLQSLRQRIIRAGFDGGNVRYYYACEYGTKPHKTHRPHIHLMFFVGDSNIDKLWLSDTIADLWKYGRTDGRKYRGVRYVINHNVVLKHQLSSRLRTINYITKYLQKSCLFQDKLNKRVAVVMRKLAEYVCTVRPDEGYYPVITSDEWLESEAARRERLHLLRLVNQFHHTSQNFGASALRDFDFDDLVIRNGCIMPHSGNVKIFVPLSQYYKRKMFYDKVIVNGSSYWQLNDYGLEFQQKRKQLVFDDTVRRLQADMLTAGISYDAVELSDYVLNYRGYILSSSDQSSFSIQDRFDNIDFYNYSTCSDKLQFNQRGLSKCWLGDSQQGYNSSKILDRVSLQQFISKYVYFDQEKEDILSKISNIVGHRKAGKQDMYKLRQRMSNLCKMLS